MAGHSLIQPAEFLKYVSQIVVVAGDGGEARQLHAKAHERHHVGGELDDNVGFFIRDNIWAMVRSEKERMDNNDKELFKNIKPKLLEINKKKSLYYENRDNYYGFGWSHNFKKLGIRSEGPISTLFFRTDKNYGDLKLEVSCRPYITKKNNIMELDVYVNNVFNQSIKLAKKRGK